MRSIELNRSEIFTLKGCLYRDALNYQGLLLKVKSPHQHEYYADRLDEIFRIYWRIEGGIIGDEGRYYDTHMNSLENWFDEYNQLEAALEE